MDLYIYVSNESPQNVYFDDLTVKHFTGPLVPEQSYYPFGLEIGGISSKGFLRPLRPYKYNGSCEFENEGSLDYYNTFYRKYDAQIGRFTGVDIRNEESYAITLYNFRGSAVDIFLSNSVALKQNAWCFKHCRLVKKHTTGACEGWRVGWC